MIKKITIWYKQLPALKQLVLLLIGNYILWFVFSMIKNSALEETGKPILHAVMDALFLGTFMTVFFNWKKMKVVFKSKENKVVN